MTARRRTFSIDELHEIGVPDELDPDVEVADQHLGTGRWTDRRRCVFRHDGTVWGVRYERGLTEHQDIDDYGWYGDVEAIEMQPREVTTVTWVPAE